MANDPTVISHPDKIDDVLEAPQPGTSDAAKSDPKKKDTTYKENKTSPDELISLDELYTVTGQEALEIVVDGYRELKNHQRLSRAHGEAAKLDASGWIEFPDKSNALRYGDAFVRQLTQSSPQTFADGEHFANKLLKRSQERSKTILGMMERTNNRLIPQANGLATGQSTGVGAKLTVFIRPDETVKEGITRLYNTVQWYPQGQKDLKDWANQVGAAVTALRQAQGRSALFNALQQFNDLSAVPNVVNQLCQIFCGEFPNEGATPRQVYLATEKNMRFKDVVLTETSTRLDQATDRLLSTWFTAGEGTLVGNTSEQLSDLAQALTGVMTIPPSLTKDTELLFACMEALRTCTRLSMTLDMVQGLLQSLSVVIFTALRARIETTKANVVVANEVTDAN